jgi:hypothetical protein
MTQDEIIELAREAAAIHGHTFKDVPSKETVEFITAFAKLVADKAGDQQYALGWLDGNSAGIREGVDNEREACELIEHDLAKSPAMFATMAEYKSYRNGVEKYRAAILARGES